MKILLVDNEPDFLEQAKIFLERRDNRLSIETATSAEEALELLDGDNYNAIVSDFKMPEVNGLEFLKSLRKNGNNIPFILLTGKGNEEVAAEALNLGADGYFRKDGSKAKFALLADSIIEEVENRQREEREKFLWSFVWRDFVEKTQAVKGYLEILEDFGEENPEGFFQLLEMLIEEEEKHLEMLTRMREFKSVGISSFRDKSSEISEEEKKEIWNFPTSKKKRG